MPPTVLLRPVVAVSVTVFRVPVVRPTPLFTPVVTVFAPLAMTPGFFTAVLGAAGAVFCAAGVGMEPSGAGFAGVFLTDVAFDAAPVAGFTGVEGLLVVLVAVEVVFETGTDPLTTTGVLVDVVEASLGGTFVATTGVFFAGATPDGPDLSEVGVLREVAGSGFFVPMGVLAVAGFAGFEELEARSLAGVAVLLSLAGVLLTGVVAVLVAGDVVETGVTFFTGVTVGFTGVAVLGVVDAAFADVAVGFFAAGSAP